MTVGRRAKSVLGAAALAVVCAACGGGSTRHAASTPTAPSTDLKQLTSETKTDAATQGQYLTRVAELDTDLETYVTSNGQVAVQALISSGEAFCAYLKQGGGIDNAMVSVAQGAQSESAKTHLPGSVQTFNTIDSVALITLCPTELTLVPADTQTKLKGLQKTLAAGSATVKPTP